MELGSKLEEPEPQGSTLNPIIIIATFFSMILV